MAGRLCRVKLSTLLQSLFKNLRHISIILDPPVCECDRSCDAVMSAKDDVYLSFVSSRIIRTVVEKFSQNLWVLV